MGSVTTSFTDIRGGVLNNVKGTQINANVVKVVNINLKLPNVVGDEPVRELQHILSTFIESDIVPKITVGAHLHASGP